MIVSGTMLGATQAPRTRVLVVVGNREIRNARNTLLALAARLKGARLSPWQKRQIATLAGPVARRKKRGISPVLSRDQALQIYQIVGGTS